MACNRQHGYLIEFGVLLEKVQYPVAIHVGHIDIQQDKRRLVGSGQFESEPRRRCGEQIHSGQASQHAEHQLQVGRIVLDKQDRL